MTSSVLNSLLATALSLAVSCAVIGAMLHLPIARFALDEPNRRSLHEKPVSRLGGIGILLGMLAGWLFAGAGGDWRLAVGFALLIGVSMLDDFGHVHVLIRLTLHLIGALIAMAALLGAYRDLWLIAIAALATAWMTNLYNFMDGSDGLAGGMAAIGFAAYGFMAQASGDMPFAAMNFSVSAAALGFLFFNFPPARIFMGDVGAIPLGYLAAVFGVLGWQRGEWPIWFGAVIFSPFIVDASCTLVKRMVRGVRIWQAHREHYYQRLVQAGWGHRKTALVEYALMTFVAAVGAAACRGTLAVQIAAIAALAAFYGALIALLERSLPSIGNHA